MKIKLSDKYTLSRDAYGWQVTRHYLGMSRKTNELAPMERVRYAANLEGCATIICNDLCSEEGETSIAEFLTEFKAQVALLVDRCQIEATPGG